MSGEVTLVGAGTMLLADQAGSVAVGDGSTHGLFLDDIRHLSRWQLEVSDAALLVLARVEGSSSRSVALGPVTTRNEPPGFILTREQEVGRDGLHERWRIARTASGTADFAVRLTAGADFVDQFALRSDGREFGTQTTVTAYPTADGGGLDGVVTHGDATITHRTRIRTDPAPRRIAVVGRAVVHEWRGRLEPGAETVIEVRALARPSSSVEPSPSVELVETPPIQIPHRAAADLDALTMPCPGLESVSIPAAGAPWFLTLFGRDSLLTALLAQPERPALLPAVVEALAATQADAYAPEQVAEPGKIVHEVRVGDLARLGLVPYGRYYGTVDATALFLMGLGALPDTLAAAPALESAARAAVDWLRGPGGLDSEGWVTYRPDPRGLINQGWKDSADAVGFADGRPSEGPIALCEVQGYAWRGLVETARLARSVWNGPDWADELDALAASLRTRLIDAFWMADENFPALALDGSGRRVDALASNAGHLLWCGVLDADRARAVADRLLAPEFFTGFGVRTLARGQARYAPMSYHNGSVWPHDTMLAAIGMYAAGLTDHARRVASGMLAAADAFGGRLPELFGGFDRTDIAVPVRYPRAGSPQAWAAAATLVAARLVQET